MGFISDQNGPFNDDIISKIGSRTNILWITYVWKFSWELPRVFYNRTSELGTEAEDLENEHLAECRFKPIMIFCALIIGCPILGNIWKRNSNRVAIPPKAVDSHPNAATSGVPSEIGEGELIIPKCTSVFISKMQYPVDLLARRCGNDIVSPCRLGKFDGCSSPLQSIKYIEGLDYIDLCSTCSTQYPNHVKTSKCYIRLCQEAGFLPMVGSEVKIERRTHMAHRVSAQQ